MKFILKDNEEFTIQGTLNNVNKEINLLTLDASALENATNISQLLGELCPIIEDTRTSNSVAITGIAPFAALNDKQQILLHSKYMNTGSGAYTLNLTLSNNTSTSAKNIKYVSSTNTWNNANGNLIRSGAYIHLIYDQEKDAWLLDLDYNTTYESIGTAEINTGTATTGRLISAKILRDNFYTETEIDSSLSIKANLDSPTFTGTPTAPTASANTNTTQIATTAFVQTAIENLPSPMVFKGSLGTNGTITSLPVNGTATIGDTYKVITAGTYAGVAADVGDTYICLTKTSNANTWELIPSGDEPSGTVTSVAMSVPTGLTVSGSPITGSGTLAVTLTNGYSIPTTNKQSQWDTAYTNNHTHSNKTVLDGISSTDITNWNNKLDSYTETDPTVPSWAKASTKPTYTASEVGALPDTTSIPNESTVSGWGFTKNAGTITGITMNGSSKGTSGVVNLGTVITSETQLSKGTTTGSGNAVTDIAVSNHQITLTKGTTFLTSHQTLKTINGSSIVGSGDLTVSGLPTVTSSDNGKILQVVNGTWTLVSPVTLYSGSAEPNNASGIDGDLYIQS